MIKSLKGKTPSIHPSAFIAKQAVIVGDVAIGARSSIWFNTVARGDVHHIKIGEGTNVQDNSMLHVTGGMHPLEIGDHVTIGHNAIVHGCVIKNRVLIGMGAVVLDGAEINEESIVGAGAVVPPGFVLPSGKLAVGVPAKVARDLTNEERESIRTSADNYIKNSKNYMEEPDFAEGK
ncbi:MAG: gamma carbonic anhydrase family protein [Candidatus Mycalebacterium zealandia]|nr:MAG: gamma carbonic anhydrase family protein [Candidatus Mycalebacterium zealandia]